MNLFKILGSLLLGSAIALSFGGFLLYSNKLVPTVLLELTVVAVIALLPLGFFVSKRNILATNISTVLGVIAPIISTSTPAHAQVLIDFGRTFLISILGLLQFLGFYVFPITFVILRLVFRRNLALTMRSKDSLHVARHRQEST